MNMVPLPCGYCGSFVSLRAYVMLGVQLPTRVSSPDRSTSVRLEFSPTVPLSVLCCFRAGPNLIEAQNSLTYRGPLPLSCSCGREHIPFIGLSGDSTFRTSSSVGFGAGFLLLLCLR